jgi:hypothetical protein
LSLDFRDFFVRAGLRLACCFLLTAGCGTPSDTLDLYRGQPATCEVHGQRMQVQKVGLTYGIQPQTPLTTARSRQFPHADEPHNAGCNNLGHRYGHVYVCAGCEKARQVWHRKNPPSAAACSSRGE